MKVASIFLILTLLVAATHAIAQRGWSITGPIGASSVTPPVDCDGGVPTGEMDFSKDCNMVYVPALFAH